MRIFLAATSLRPAYGGPAYSVARLATALAEVGAQVGLWSSDQSGNDTSLLNVDAKVSRLRGSAAEALNRFGPPDIVHDNGIWLLHNHQLAKLSLELGAPRVISTRGMLEPWAMRHKFWKKRLAWTLYQRSDLKRASCLHATAPSESKNLRELGFSLPIYTIPNGVDLPKRVCPAGTAGNGERQKTALFLGRIYPIKGLPMLIEAWRRVCPEDWVLHIAGPDEGGHRSDLERAVAASGLSGVISFLGPITLDQKHETFLGADLLVLPSHSESFGMVIAEAMAHGLPALTTTAAPWPMLNEYGCGWSVDATVDGITQGLREATAKDRQTLQDLGAKGRKFVAEKFGWERIAEQFLATYEDLIAKRTIRFVVDQQA